VPASWSRIEKLTLVGIVVTAFRPFVDWLVNTFR
jgi:hypothetical protein